MTENLITLDGITHANIWSIEPQNVYQLLLTCENAEDRKMAERKKEVILSAYDICEFEDTFKAEKLMPVYIEKGYDCISLFSKSRNKEITVFLKRKKLNSFCKVNELNVFYLKERDIAGILENGMSISWDSMDLYTKNMLEKAFEITSVSFEVKSKNDYIDMTRQLKKDGYTCVESKLGKWIERVFIRKK